MYNKFDIVYGSGINISLILSGPIEVPTYDDGVASDYSMEPLDIQNPNEWARTFTGYIVYDLIKDRHEIVSINQISGKYNGDITEGYIPFDLGTGRMRLTLGLISLAEKWYGEHQTSYFKSLGTKLRTIAMKAFM